MVGLVQQTPSSEVMTRIRQLEQENADLRASQADPGMHPPAHREDSQSAEPPLDERGITTPVRRNDREMPPPLHSPLTQSGTQDIDTYSSQQACTTDTVVRKDVTFSC